MITCSEGYRSQGPEQRRTLSDLGASRSLWLHMGNLLQRLQRLSGIISKNIGCPVIFKFQVNSES